MGITTYPPVTKDSYVQQEYPTQNRGTWIYLNVKSRLGEAIRTLIEFDLSEISAGSIINSATLSLYVAAVGNITAFPRKYRAERIIGSWGETEVNWNNQPAVTSPPYNDIWVYATDVGIWKTWNVLLLVQEAWEIGGLCGIRIKDTDEAASFPITSFPSRENAENNPILEVTWTPPIVIIERFQEEGADFKETKFGATWE